MKIFEFDTKVGLETLNLAPSKLLWCYDTEQHLLMSCSNKARYDDIAHQKKQARVLFRLNSPVIVIVGMKQANESCHDTSTFCIQTPEVVQRNKCIIVNHFRVQSVWTTTQSKDITT